MCDIRLCVNICVHVGTVGVCVSGFNVDWYWCIDCLHVCKVSE